MFNFVSRQARALAYLSFPNAAIGDVGIDILTSELQIQVGNSSGGDTAGNPFLWHISKGEAPDVLGNGESATFTAATCNTGLIMVPFWRLESLWAGAR